MKNKIFLTSMLAVMVACPVFAETVYHVDEGNTSADCVLDDDLTDAIPPRETGTYTLTAQWEAETCTITLDANGGTDGTQTQLWTKYGDTYESDPHGAFVQNTYTLANLMTTAGANAITGTARPTGPSANTSYNMGTIPTDPSTNSQYSVTTVQNQTRNLAFDGFTQTSASNSTKYIDDAGIITSDGDSAANIADCPAPAPTWYAQWKCFTRALPSTSLTGYDITWHKGSVSGTQATGSDCITTDETLYAKYTPKKYTITYNCGTGGSFKNNISPAFHDAVAHEDEATYDSGYNFRSATDTCEKSGYTPNWSCVQAGTSTAAETNTGSYWKNDYNVECTATWDGVINLEWSTPGQTIAPTSCIYNTVDGISVPTPVDRTGYTFKGWTVTSYSNQ